jgi:hypothetical protein
LPAGSALAARSYQASAAATLSVGVPAAALPAFSAASFPVLLEEAQIAADREVRFRIGGFVLERGELRPDLVGLGLDRLGFLEAGADGVAERNAAAAAGQGFRCLQEGDLRAVFARSPRGVGLVQQDLAAQPRGGLGQRGGDQQVGHGGADLAGADLEARGQLARRLHGHDRVGSAGEQVARLAQQDEPRRRVAGGFAGLLHHLGSQGDPVRGLGFGVFLFEDFLDQSLGPGDVRRGRRRFPLFRRPGPRRDQTRPRHQQ